jgi:hypothetical protein
LTVTVMKAGPKTTDRSPLAGGAEIVTLNLDAGHALERVGDARIGELAEILGCNDLHDRRGRPLVLLRVLQAGPNAGAGDDNLLHRPRGGIASTGGDGLGREGLARTENGHAAHARRQNRSITRHQCVSPGASVRHVWRHA